MSYTRVYYADKSLNSIKFGDLLITTKYPNIDHVIFSPPATVVFFEDGTKVVSKCDKEDRFDKATGVMTCMLKKMLGKKKFHELMDEFVYTEDK